MSTSNRGQRYYTWSERKFAIATFLVGFLGMWVGDDHHRRLLPRPGLEPVHALDYWDPHKVDSAGQHRPALHSSGSAAEMGAMLFAPSACSAGLVAIPGAFWQWKKALRDAGSWACLR